MKFEFHDSKMGSMFGFTNDIKKYSNQFAITSGNITILWNRNNDPVEQQVVFGNGKTQNEAY